MGMKSQSLVLAGNDFVAGEWSEVAHNFISSNGMKMKMGNTWALKNLSHNLGNSMNHDENFHNDSGRVEQLSASWVAQMNY